MVDLKDEKEKNKFIEMVENYISNGCLIYECYTKADLEEVKIPGKFFENRDKVIVMLIPIDKI